MNIAFFDATPHHSGSVNRILFLSKEISKFANKVLIICLPNSKLSQEARKIGIETLNLKPLCDLDLFCFFRVLFALKKYKIEIVDIYSPLFYWIGVWASRILRIKVILTRNVAYRKRTKLKRKINSFFLYRLCHKVIAVSRYVKNSLEEDYKIKNIALIYDAVFNQPRELTKDEILKQKKRFGIKKDDIVLAVVGRLEKNKGQEIAIDAISQVCKIYKNVKLLIVGWGNPKYIKKLKRIIEDKNLNEVVILTGFVDDMAEIYNIIDIFIQASLAEGLSVSLLEALSYKKPVVATCVGGTAEVVKDGVNGYLVRPADSQDLAKGIIKLLNSQREFMGREGFKIVNEKFSKERLLEDYIKVLNNVLES